MPVDYNPKDVANCWPVDDYDAELVKVEDKTSKVKPDGSGGNAMQVLTWKVYHPDGKSQLISDYIVIPAALFKLKQLAVALGKKDQFEASEFQADDQIGCSVIAELAIEQSDGFEDKNKIKKVKAPTTATAPATNGPPAKGPTLPPRAPSSRPRTAPAGLISEEKVLDDIPFAFEGRDEIPI